MLGQIIRAARIKKGLTQARLARLAGVSRRHLAALEKGANVSVLVLKKVAAVLELTEIDLGDVTLKTNRPAASAINMPLLAETIHEAHAEALRTQALLAKAEGLFGEEKKLAVMAHFPTLAARVLDVTSRRGGAVADHDVNVAQLPISAELEQGQPIRDTPAAPSPPEVDICGLRAHLCDSTGMTECTNRQLLRLTASP